MYIALGLSLQLSAVLQDSFARVFLVSCKNPHPQEIPIPSGWGMDISWTAQCIYWLYSLFLAVHSWFPINMDKFLFRLRWDFDVEKITFNDLHSMTSWRDSFQHGIHCIKSKVHATEVPRLNVKASLILFPYMYACLVFHMHSYRRKAVSSLPIPSSAVLQ